MTKMATMAAVKLPMPSKRNSHFHPASPETPSRPANTPAAMRPENAVARTRPEDRTAVRRASSFRVYQQDMT
jgi:hypothetical protein